MISLGENVADPGMKKQTSEHKKWWEKSQMKKKKSLIKFWNVQMSKKNKQNVEAYHETKYMSEISQRTTDLESELVAEEGKDGGKGY